MNFSFADAINQLTDGKAAKRPSWRGFVKRVDGQNGAYDIIYVKPPVTPATQPTTYTYHVAANGSVTTTDTLTQTAELFVGMISTDWIVGDTTDFETCLAGSGEW